MNRETSIENPNGGRSGLAAPVSPVDHGSSDRLFPGDNSLVRAGGGAE
jgi:hypothetical protein